VEELRTRFDGLHQHQEEVDDPLDDEDEDDDGRSVSTVGREPGRRGDGEDAVELFEDLDDELIMEEGGRSGLGGRGTTTDAFFGRPTTPEPNSQHRLSFSDCVKKDEDPNSAEVGPVPSSPRSSSSRPEEPSVLESLRQQVSTLNDNSQLVLAQNEALALRLQSLEAERSEVLSSISLVLGRVVGLEEKEKGWMEVKVGWTREKASMDEERKKMMGVIKEWEESKRRGEEEQEEVERDEGRCYRCSRQAGGSIQLVVTSLTSSQRP